MKKTAFLPLVLLLLCFLIIDFNGFGQETEAETPTEKETPQVKTIALNETEKLGQRIRRLEDVLKPMARTEEIDSLLTNAYSGINTHRDTLLEDLPNYSQRDLQKENVEWSNYKSELKDYQSTIDSRIKVLNSLNDEIVDEIQRWVQTKENLTENTESDDLFANMDTMIFRLQGIVNVTLLRLDSVFIIQKRLTEVVLVIDEVISEIGRAEILLKKDYFVFDNPAIWNVRKINTINIDTTAVDTLGLNEKIISGVDEDFQQLGTFIGNNIKTFIFQIIFILLLLALIIVVKRKWTKGVEELKNPLEQEAKIVIANPISTSVALGMLISAFFYEARIPVYNEILILLILGCTSYVLPKLTHKNITLPLLIVLFVYIIQFIEIYFNPESIYGRLLLLLNTALLAYAFTEGRMVINMYPERFKRISAFRRYILPFYLVFMLIAFIANIIGMVNLSRFLTSAVLTSVGLGAVVYLSVKVSTSIIILIFKLRSHFNLTTLTNLVEVIQKRVRPFLMLVGIILWLLFTLQGFEIFDFLKLWVNDLLMINWKIGEMTISVGGILAFMTIFFITMFLAKIVANIFQDEWLIKVLPRGIAPAISLITRILLIVTGFYMGLSAAGFDLSKIGLLLGALGVGIGFGLQSVVLNFISGLILAFERPINLGDAIEVDQEFGIVTSIGVRASNIKTYKGSEVIIPNGDLVSKKVINWTLSNRDRRSRILMKTSSDADPEKVIQLFNAIAMEHPSVYKKPAPDTLFYGYNQEGNLDFALIYWTSFSDTLNTDSDIALKIYKTLKREGIQAPIPKWKIVGDDKL